MKNRIFITTTLLFSILIFALSTSCNQIPGKKEENKSGSLKETISEQQISSGETWLKSIFQCTNGVGYCFPDEEKVFTEQYYQFFIESLAIFEYPDFETEEEQIAAEKAYKNKWKDAYPLGKEVWAPFGRGNGVEAGDKLENVTITHLSDLKYTALVNYGEGMIFFNALLLVPSGDAFLIDYIKTDFIDLPKDEIYLPFFQNLALANLQLGANPSDAKRLLGKPQSEFTEEGPSEVSSYIDEDQIVSTTTLEFDGIRLIYEDDRMIHAYINKTGKSFGWIICGDKNCDKGFLVEKFQLTEEDFYENDEGDKTIVMGGFLTLNITLDADELVKTIEFNTGP